MAEKIVAFSNSPHVRSKNTTRRIMINVCIALLPACVAGCVFFGWQAITVLATAVLSAVASEFVYLLILRKPFKQIAKEFDFSTVVTGLLVGMSLGSTSPLYIPAFASVFAIIVVKMLFGGTGKNLVNPAIAGRIFVFISFSIQLDSFVTPNISAINDDVITGATSLKSLISDGSHLSNLDLLLGTGVGGCIGETCKIALIIGGIYLVCMGILNFRWPIVYIAATGLMTVVLNGFNFEYFLPSILSGGLMLGAIFMATDYVTSPNTKAGCYVYYLLLGVLTAVLREVTGYEVVSFAILLMNLLVPLFDKWIVNRPFGYVRVKKNKEGK